MDKFVDKIATTTTTSKYTRRKKEWDKQTESKLTFSRRKMQMFVCYFEWFKLLKRRRQKVGKENARAHKHTNQTKQKDNNEWRE